MTEGVAPVLVHLHLPSCKALLNWSINLNILTNELLSKCTCTGAHSTMNSGLITKHLLSLC